MTSATTLKGVQQDPIGEVVGHKDFGLALVQWKDGGLRPIGTLLYAAPPKTQFRIARPAPPKGGGNKIKRAIRK